MYNTTKNTNLLDKIFVYPFTYIVDKTDIFLYQDITNLLNEKQIKLLMLIEYMKKTALFFCILFVIIKLFL